MTPILIIMAMLPYHQIPMASMDACIIALRAQKPATMAVSQCLDPRTGEVVLGRKYMPKNGGSEQGAHNAEVAGSIPALPTTQGRASNDDDFERGI